MMTTEQIDSPQASYVQVIAMADIAAQLFCNHLLEHDAKLKRLLRDDGGGQKSKLMRLIGQAVASLDHADALTPALHELGKTGATCRPEPPDYIALGAAFLVTLERRLGAALRDDVRAAWIAVYGLLAAMMQAAEIAA